MEKRTIRLNKYLASCGLGSRRKCDELIAAGAIKVNGELITEMGSRVDPDTDQVEFYNQPVESPDRQVYILLNKPPRTVTTVSDEKRRRTVVDLVDIQQRIFPVGRLDYNTTGALLLTTDGKLTYLLTHPKFEVSKIYRVLLDKRIRPIDLHHFRKGIQLDDRMTAPCKVEELRIMDNASYLEVELHEGRNRQIRRMLEVLGYQVKKLHRIEFAGLRVDNLQTGEWRRLSHQEIEKLNRLVESHQADILGDVDE
jgi:pseudouridine synthase